MRSKILRLSPELLASFLKRPAERDITADGMPMDARIVSAGWDGGSIVLHLESATFERVSPMAKPPELAVTFTRDRP